jgi:hypothetical protein
MHYEFSARDPAATTATMSRNNSVNHVPVLTGGNGPEELREFYERYFIPQMPADTKLTPVCRSVGQGRVIDEIVVTFTHDLEMDWMLPGGGGDRESALAALRGRDPDGVDAVDVRGGPVRGPAIRSGDVEAVDAPLERRPCEHGSPVLNRDVVDAGGHCRNRT